MEEILNSLVVAEAKPYVPWKQIAGAVALAVLTAALCICVMKSSTFVPERAKAVTEIHLPEDRSGLGPKIRNSIEELKMMGEKERNACMNEMLADFVKETGKEAAGLGTGAVFHASAGSVSGSTGIKDNMTGEGISEKETLKEAGKDRKNLMRDTSAEKEEKASEKMPEKAEEAASSENGKLSEAVKEASADTGMVELELDGNGGTPEYRRDSCERSSFEIEKYEEPERLGKVFDGWYLDSECKTPFDGLGEDVKSLKLYAGWREFTGFLSNEKGHITGYTDAAKVVSNHLFVLPTHKSCTGIEKSAVEGLETEIDEIYIPANITYIETELFHRLPNLMYIQVEDGNPNYYSKDGCLYQKNGKLVAVPWGLE